MPQQSSNEVKVAKKRLGRPIKPFEELGDKSKRNRTVELRKSVGLEELTFATQISLKQSGQNDAAKLLKQSTSTTPTRASKILNSFKNSTLKVEKYSNDEALALLIDAKLTKKQYTLIRLQSKKKFSNLYPTYDLVREAKKKCYPSENSILLSETSAEIKLQALLDHTVKRIFETIDNNLEIDCNELTLLTKWGCDGSSGYSEYKQKYQESNENKNDSDIFLVSIVPIILFEKLTTESKNEIWTNPQTSSTRYCRPLHIKMEKETTELIKNEVNLINKEIENLQPTLIEHCSKQLIIKHKLILTMVDGKICNVISDNQSTQQCYICMATPKEMNNIDKVINKTVKHHTMSFGISPLHARIRFFECILHLSYRLSFKKWQARGAELQNELKKNKKLIQDRFKIEMGLKVDQPKQGSGTSNDGNTARRFFDNPNLSSNITGVDLQLIHRLAVILQVLSCGHEINHEKFDTYSKETAKLFVTKYPWFYMPVTLHKVLIHGSDIIKVALLPIGQLSEDALEARHKDMKRYRTSNTRKNSRKNTMCDLLNSLLISSDPFIASLREKPQIKKKNAMARISKFAYL